MNWYNSVLKMQSPEHLEPSEECVALIAKWEGFMDQAYQDIVGRWTIGYGETLGVKPGDKTTEEKARQHLRKRASYFWDEIKDSIEVPLTQSMCDALTSFSYNVGQYAFRDSTLLKRLNEGEYSEAADELLRWNKAGGNVVRGLSNRRKEEREVFLSGIL